MLDKDFNLKLIDLGLAKDVKETEDGMLKTRLGTPGYMAPELFNNKKNYRGIEVDLFALGVMLFIMYSAERPFDKATPDDQMYKYLITKR